MEFRKIFDTIPERFDKYRPRYSAELFAELISYAELGEGSKVLELGPGTGQATEPILDTGCDYTAIELGENLASVMERKFHDRTNFNIIVDDFITHDFGQQKFDLIYSASTIQWIPEEIAFPKVFTLLRPGGTLAMLLTRGDYKSSNEALYNKIQSVYSAHFRPTEVYKGGYRYDRCTEYGFRDFQRREFYGQRVFTADEYVAFCGTHCDHLVIEPEHKKPFFEGLKQAVLEAGDRIVFNDTYVLMTAAKPL